MTEAIVLKGLALGEGKPKICASMTGPVRKDLLLEAEALKRAGVQIAEWRADTYRELQKPEEVKETLLAMNDILGQIPLIFTIRTQKEGGNLQIAPRDYIRINRTVSSLGMASLIDVEVFQDQEQMSRLIGEIHQEGGRVVASRHDFGGTPPNGELTEILKTLDASGGDVIKLACMPRTPPDVWRLLEVTSRMSSQGTKKPVVTMSMGELGRCSRFLGELCGSALTFGTLKHASAPGQPPVEELKEMLEALHQTAAPKRLG